MPSRSITASARPLIGWLGLRRWLQLPGPAPQPQPPAASARTRGAGKVAMPLAVGPHSLSAWPSSAGSCRLQASGRESLPSSPGLTSQTPGLSCCHGGFSGSPWGKGAAISSLSGLTLPSKVALSSMQSRMTVSSS